MTTQIDLETVSLHIPAGGMKSCFRPKTEIKDLLKRLLNVNRIIRNLTGKFVFDIIPLNKQ